MRSSAERQERLRHYWRAARRYIRLGGSHALMCVAGRFRASRWMAARWARKWRSHTAAIHHDGSLLEDVDVDNVVSGLQADGLVTGLRLRPEALRSLQLFCEEGVCFGNGESRYPLHIAEKAMAEQKYGTKFSIARYLGSLHTCPTVERLAVDPTILAIAGQYFGAEPVLLGGRTWWSFPAESSTLRKTFDGQCFHYDLDDYYAMAFLFYLSDVDEQSGPHIYVRTSHRRKPLRFLLAPLRSRPDQKIVDFYGPGSIILVCGSAGSGFVEDLFCYHKGSHPLGRNRLVLQFRYGLRRYGNEGPGE